MIDVVIPAHIKDIDTLELCISNIKENVIDVGRVFVISRDRLTENAEWIPEKDFPFTLDDVSDIIGKHWRTCWYYQQVLKLSAHEVVNDLCDNYLVVDSDTIFLSPTKFVDGDKTYFNIGAENYLPYFEHMGKLMPGLTRQTSDSGITHHMLFSKDILDEIKNDVEQRFDMPFWKAFLETTTGHFNTVMGDQSHEGQGRASEYELYFNYCLSKYPNRVHIRKLKSILAYKEELNNDSESHTIGSRTNDDVHIRIMGEDVPSFEDIQESFDFCINRCKELGYDSITFQKHTRQGIEGYKQDSENYIMEVCDDTN
tara:strand:+ start:908 stop:1846 length:939 start_codon:yes stop_codon:yes gene_type:complete